MRNSIVKENSEDYKIYEKLKYIRNFISKEIRDIEDKHLNEILNTSVYQLELSPRAMNTLLNNDIRYLGELIQKSAMDLLRNPNFGRKSLAEVESVLKERDLSLNMNNVVFSRNNIIFNNDNKND